MSWHRREGFEAPPPSVRSRPALDATGSARREPKSVMEVTAEPWRLSWNVVTELWTYREVMWAFVVRQVKVKYKQAAVGIGWAVLQPVIGALLFALFLGKLSRVGSEEVPYLAFALAGMVAWTFFSTAAAAAAESLVSNQVLLRKIFFPREVLPLAAVAATMVDLLPGLATLGVVAALYGFLPTLTWLALPLPLLVLVATAAAVGLFVSAANVYYRDVRHALPFILSMLLFASPVVYSLGSVPGGWREFYAIVNPVAAAIDGFRRIFLHSQWPDFTMTLGALAFASLTSIISYLVFKRLERGFSDYV